MKLNLKFLVVILLTGLLLYQSNPILTLAQFSESTPSAKIKVNHFPNIFEKLGEKITLFFKFSKEDKADLEQELVEKRLAEVLYMIEEEDFDRIEEITSRYITYNEVLIGFLKTNNLKSKKDQAQKMFQDHMKILESKQQKFERDSGWWIYMLHTINSAKNSKEQLDKL